MLVKLRDWAEITCIHISFLALFSDNCFERLISFLHRTRCVRGEALHHDLNSEQSDDLSELYFRGYEAFDLTACC